MKRTLIALALVGAVAAAPAFAADTDNGFYATAGVNVLNPNAHELSTETRPVVGIGYAFDRNWAVELNTPLQAYRERVAVDGYGRVASFRARPTELSGLYHFDGLSDTWSPYVGLGYAWTRTTDESGRGALAGVPVSLDNANGPLARVGIDWNFDRNWFARADATYLDLDTHARVAGLRSNELAGNSWQYGVALGYRF